MRTLPFFVLLLAVVFACNNTPQPSEETTGEETTPTEEATKKYTLTAFEPSKAYPDAKIESMEYADGTFAFTLADGEYKLGEQTPDAGIKMCANSGKGQHIHLIIDNAPYAAKYVAEFDHEVEDGEHYLLAFLSRSYHESIKTEDASQALKITTENKSITYAEPIQEAMLFYSRPKGTYVGSANTAKVMLDFYPVNVALGEEYMVKAEINGEEHMLDVWQPYYIEGLPMGDNTVKLSLVDKSGALVDAPLNPVERTFKLEPDPAEAQ